MNEITETNDPESIKHRSLQNGSNDKDNDRQVFLKKEKENSIFKSTDN